MHGSMRRREAPRDQSALPCGPDRLPPTLRGGRGRRPLLPLVQLDRRAAPRASRSDRWFARQGAARRLAVRPGHHAEHRAAARKQLVLVEGRARAGRWASARADRRVDAMIGRCAGEPYTVRGWEKCSHARVMTSPGGCRRAASGELRPGDVHRGRRRRARPRAASHRQIGAVGGDLPVARQDRERERRAARPDARGDRPAATDGRPRWDGRSAPGSSAAPDWRGRRRSRPASRRRWRGSSRPASALAAARPALRGSRGSRRRASRRSGRTPRGSDRGAGASAARWSASPAPRASRRCHQATACSRVDHERAVRSAARRSPYAGQTRKRRAPRTNVARLRDGAESRAGNRHAAVRAAVGRHGAWLPARRACNPIG
jgi:hypothetical protein